MSKSKRIKVILIPFLWILVIAWIIVCFKLSSQYGVESGNFSLKISRNLICFFKLDDTLLYSLNKLLRTFAHIAVFAILTFIAGCACGVSAPTQKNSYLWPLLPCALLSIFDEIRKAYIPGRHCSFFEAALNVLGCIIGTLMVCFLIKYLKNRLRKPYRT